MIGWLTDIRGLLGYVALLAGSIWYCMPGHPAASGMTSLDVVAHVALFAVVTFFALARGPARSMLVLVVGAAVILELIQRHFGGFEFIEWRDVVSNVFGVVVGWLGYETTRRLRAHRSSDNVDSNHE